MKANRHWEDHNGCYELHFYRYGDDEVVLKFTVDQKDNSRYWYVCNDLNAPEGNYEFYNSIEEAKEDFEERYEQYLEDQVAYYEELLEQWNEEGRNNANPM